MQIRNLALPVVLIGLLGSLALGRGGAKLSLGNPNSVLPSASTVAPSLLLAAPAPLTGASLQQALPPTGPQPVNLLTVGLYLNNYHSNNSGVQDVALGDFNGDGKRDMVVVDKGTCISVLPGDGTGQFSAAPVDSCVLPSTGGFLVVAGDFNHDGILDVAVLTNPCCPSSGTVMLAQGNGDGTFTYINSVGLSGLAYGETISNLLAADLNHDGNLDLVVTTSGGNSDLKNAYVLLGNGSFSFSQTRIAAGLGCNPNANGGVIGDFNHDGIPDLAVTNSGCFLHEVDVSLGKGDGTFQAPVGYPTDANGAASIASGDINGDGIPDIAITTGAGGNPISVFLGIGDGTFGKSIDTPTVYNPDYLAVGDFNGDGKADVIVSSDYEGGGDVVGVQLSNGDGTFTPTVQYAVIPSPQRVFVGDLNGDGHPDWVSVSSGWEYVTVGLGSGDGGFLAGVNSYTTPGAAGATTAIAAADFNKDGNLDYATVGSERNYPGLNISLGDGHGNFAVPVHYTAGSNPVALTTGDFNHDGYPDIAVLDASDDTVTVLLNNGDGTLASGVGYGVGSGGGLIQTADFNHDGNPDLVVTNAVDGTVSVLLGNPNGTFQSQQVSPAQANGFYMTIGDFNGDGRPDVAVTNYNYNSTSPISILLGNGNGTFQAPIVTTGPQQDTGLAAGDFNHDGKVDLAVSTQSISNGSGGNSGVVIYLGLGNGSFQAPVNYPTIPAGLAGGTINSFPQLGDMNKDGNLDVVVANYNPYANGTNLGPAILLGNGDGTFTLNPAKAAVAGANQAEVALGDFNNDGSLDVAVQNYNPGNTFDTISSTVTMLLSTAGTEVVLTSAPNPSFQGQAVTFTSTVITSFPNLPTPTGTITFEIGATNVPVTLVNGVAAYTTSTLPLGRTTVHAMYSGNANFNPSTSLGLSQLVKPAVLKITTTSLPDAVQNVPYSATVTAKGGTPPYTFSITSGTLPAGLTMNSNGVISGTPTGLPGASSFTVQVTDTSSPIQMATANLSITVASNLLITTTSLPSGVVGNSYSATVTAAGGTPPYSFSISSGSLPNGLSISAGGVISGTPSGLPGTSNFTMQVKDSANPTQKATANLSIMITGALMITTTSLPPAVLGVPYDATITATGGTPPYTFSLTTRSLPNGLSMSTSGVISGTPSGLGTSDFTVQAADSSNPVQKTKANLSITVSNTLMITTTSLPNAVYRVPYRATINANGGTPPYTFTLSPGYALPFGLSLSTSGVISGKPTQPGQISNFVVQVTDSTNPVQTATANFSITVFNSLAITTTVLPNGIQGSSYHATVMASGGTPPDTFSIIGGTLPNGISLNTNGTLSGTPSSPGTSNFTVQVADSSIPVQTATANLSITVSAALTIPMQTLPPAIRETPYNYQIQVTGGVPPYLYFNDGGLPLGFLINDAGQVVGFDFADPPRTYPFSVQAYDSSNPRQVATATLSLTIEN